jgi:phospholipid/cholesterol/gamma-HCH transport system substrate-binding protein
MKFKIRFADQIVGFFLLLVLVGVAAVLILVGINQRWFAKNYYFQSLFPSGDGLAVGMPISLKGFQIGKISDIRLNEQNEVDVIFYVEDTYYSRVKPDSVLQLTTSAIGLSSSLRLLPGNNQLGPLPEKSIIPSYDSPEGQALVVDKKVDVPKGQDVIGSVIGNLNPVLDEARQTILEIRRVATSLDAAMAGTGGPVGSMVSDLSGTPARVNKAVDDISGRVNTLLDRLTVISDNLTAIAAQTRGVIGDLSTNLDTISQNLKSMTGDLKNTQGLAKRLLDPQGSVDTFLNDSNELYNQVDTAVKNANGIIAQIRSFVDFINSTRPQVASMLEKGNNTLDSAKDVLEAAKNNPLLRGGVPAPAQPAAPLSGSRDDNF